jgi:osmotically-inducible protein OsmY
MVWGSRSQDIDELLLLEDTPETTPTKTPDFPAQNTRELWHFVCPMARQRESASQRVEASMFKRIFGSAAAVILAGSTAFGSQAIEKKDLQLLKDVAAAVDRYSQFTIFDDVSASVKDGVVTLTGKVTMPYKRDDIEKRVTKVDGVKSVRDEIGVLPVSQFDDELRVRIARSIYNHANFWNYGIMPNPPIHIVVERGRVTLTGVVQSEVDRMLARSLATQFGALSVTNELKTDAEVQAALEKSE